MKKLKSFWIFISILEIFIFLCAPVYGLTIKEEEKLGNEFLSQIKRQVTLISDPMILQYIRDVGSRIIECLPNQLFQFKFYILYEKSVNAFAVPGGHIFINSGLLEIMETEEELAAILAHEMTHVICRHISERLDQAKLTNIATLAGVIAGIMLGGEAGSAITLGSIAAGQTYELSYSRENEREADQNGLRYLTEAGYSALGMINILKKMRKQDWLNVAQVPTYILTHPVSEERIVAIDHFLESHPHLIQNSIAIDRNHFKKIKARLIALYGDIENQSKIQKDVQEHPTDPYAHYSYGLFLARTGKRKEAITHLKTVLKYKAFDQDILRDLAHVYYSEGVYDAALSTLESVFALHPNDMKIFFMIGRCHVELAHYSEAIQIFHKIMDTYPDYPNIKYYLGHVYGKVGDLGNSHYYIGCFYKHEGNNRSAKFHLNQALIHDKSNRKSEIEDMLKTL